MKVCSKMDCRRLQNDIYTRRRGDLDRAVAEISDSSVAKQKSAEPVKEKERALRSSTVQCIPFSLLSFLGA